LLRPGDLFPNASHRIVRLIGRGGAGEVYEAAHQLKRFAIKVVLITERDAARYEVESRILRQIQHPNVVRVFNSGVVTTRKPGPLAWMLMELLQGRTLRQMLERRRQLPVGLACAYLQELGVASNECHAKGAVHRDVKPENVFITANDRVKLLDFGIAKLSGGPETIDGRRRGTPPYMAPEQLRGGPVTAATDVYAMGIMGFEMIGGRNPFVDSVASYDLDELYTKKFYDTPRFPPECVVPEPIASVFAKATQRKPESRYPNGLAFAKAIEEGWHRLSVEEQEAYAGSDEGEEEDENERWEALTLPLPRRAVRVGNTVRLPEAERDPTSVRAKRVSEAPTPEEVFLPPESDVRRIGPDPLAARDDGSSPRKEEINARTSSGGTMELPGDAGDALIRTAVPPALLAPAPAPISAPVAASATPTLPSRAHASAHAGPDPSTGTTRARSPWLLLIPFVGHAAFALSGLGAGYLIWGRSSSTPQVQRHSNIPPHSVLAPTTTPRAEAPPILDRASEHEGKNSDKDNIKGSSAAPVVKNATPPVALPVTPPVAPSPGSTPSPSSRPPPAPAGRARNRIF
jgi:serine/threonine-protein kinase